MSDAPESAVPAPILSVSQGDDVSDVVYRAVMTLKDGARANLAVETLVGISDTLDNVDLDPEEFLRLVQAATSLALHVAIKGKNMARIVSPEFGSKVDALAMDGYRTLEKAGLEFRRAMDAFRTAMGLASFSEVAPKLVERQEVIAREDEFQKKIANAVGSR